MQYSVTKIVSLLYNLCLVFFASQESIISVLKMDGLFSVSGVSLYSFTGPMKYMYVYKIV